MRELAPEDVWRRRYEHICSFERMLVEEGTTILKVFLNVSRDEQRARLQERIDDSEKRWKFRREDLLVRERFDDWRAAWDEAVTETSTEWAPWHVPLCGTGSRRSRSPSSSPLRSSPLTRSSPRPRTAWTA